MHHSCQFVVKFPLAVSSSGKKLSLKEQLRCKLLTLLLDFVYSSSSSARCIETFTLTFTLKNYGSTFFSFTYKQTRIMINNNSLTSWWNDDHYKSITDTLKTSDTNHQYLITLNSIQTFWILFIIKNSMLSFFSVWLWIHLLTSNLLLTSDRINLCRGHRMHVQSFSSFDSSFIQCNMLQWSFLELHWVPRKQFQL